MASPETAGFDAQLGSDHDIDKRRLGQVYAEAFLGIAEGSGQTDALVAELEQLVDQVIAKFPQLEMALASPRLSVDEKLRILEQVFQGRVSDALLRFLMVICRHGRLDCIRQIRRATQQLYDQRHQRVQVTVTTATRLDDQLVDRIRRTLSEKLGRQVRLEAQVREELIGGLVVRVGDTVFDGSIANQLNRLRRQAVERTVEQLRQGILAVET